MQEANRFVIHLLQLSQITYLVNRSVTRHTIAQLMGYLAVSTDNETWNFLIKGLINSRNWNRLINGSISWRYLSTGNETYNCITKGVN